MTKNYGLIKSIQEIDDELNGYDGCIIHTTTCNIIIAIDNDQQCCENAGYLASEDDFTDYIGAEILKIELVDENIGKIEFESDDLERESNIIFVNVETSKGTLQFAVYNCHNGYYGHEVLIKIEDEVLYNDSI